LPYKNTTLPRFWNIFNKCLHKWFYLQNYHFGQIPRHIN
jgi:hypothetical protein